MCGIAGSISTFDSRALVDEMSNLLKHRGPDSSYRWNNNECHFAMERLAICDLEGGSQPFFNEDKTIAVIFNGEIFNHVELRIDLEKKGHQFQSHHSDGEIIPHLYEEYGNLFPSYLDGMFAIAIWNSKAKELILARDQFGIKPLYYYVDYNCIFFASEIKSFLNGKYFNKDLNFSEISNYFKLGHTSAPNTIYKNIIQLGPAKLLVYKNSKFDIQNYWTPKQQVNNYDVNLNSENVFDLLEKSVRNRLDADVEVASLLSGGLDSSAVTAIASKYSHKKLKTFNLFYPDLISEGKNSDSKWARALSKELGTDHHEVAMTHNSLKTEISNILGSFSEPFAGVVSTYFISEAITKHTKVALTGDGSDEIFGSYFYPRLAATLDSNQNYDEDTSKYLGISKKNFLELKAQKNELKRRSYGVRILEHNITNFFSDKFKNLIQDSVNVDSEVQDVSSNIMDKFDHRKSKLDESLWLDFNDLLPNEILTFTDRLSMAWSLELRPVYLSKQLYEFSLTIPSNQKINHNIDKFILKKSLLKLLPPELIYRKKEGFVLPIAIWLCRELKSWATEILHPNRTESHGYWDKNAVFELIISYHEPDFRRAKLIWKFICFQIWWERYHNQ